MLSSAVPTARVRSLNERIPNPDGGYVLYWMTSARRMTCNFALERAVEWAGELGRGVVVLEALRCDYEWASDRFHRFVLDGMIDNARNAQGREGLAWYPFVERTPGAGKGLLAELAAKAAVVVTDDYPTFFIPEMLAAAADRVSVRFEAVDSNGLAPMRETRRSYPSAYTFRRYLQKSLPHYLDRPPAADPIEGLKGIATPAIPVSILEQWPSAASELASGGPALERLDCHWTTRSLPLDCVAVREKRASGFRNSYDAGCPATRMIAITPMKMRPADCLRTCTSDTYLHTRSSTGWPNGKNGHPPSKTGRQTESVLAGGA